MKKNEIATPADLTAIRKSFGFTPAQFARLLRIDRSTWHNWEKGRTAPPDAAVSLIQAISHMRNPKYGQCLMDWIADCD